MSQFDRPLSGYRFVATNQNDTLQEIAARECGDASKWVDLVNINGLQPPYLTGDSSIAGPSVKLYGQMILVPASGPPGVSETDPTAVFGTDIALSSGMITVDNGDMVTVTGRANLRQALQNRIETNLKELIFYLTYGCGIRQLLGTVNGPTAALVGAEFVNGSLIQDPRITSSTSTVNVTGDVLDVQATVTPIAGDPIDLTASP